MAPHIDHRSFRASDEVREFRSGRAEILKVCGSAIGRLIFDSRNARPIAGTASGAAPHFRHHGAGRLAIRMDDRTELVTEPREITYPPSGHDASALDDEPAVVADWFGASNYAR